MKNSKDYYNGKLGKIEAILEGKIIASIVDKAGVTKTFTVEKQTWNNIRYKFNNEKKEIEQEVLGTFTQYPIKLAWAITIHKSQGLTFEHVLINIDNWTTSGLVYVALSRCTSWNSLALQRPIKREQIMTDKRVIEFADTEATDEIIEERINWGVADASFRLARREFKNKNYKLAANYFIDGLIRRDDLESSAFKQLFPYFHLEILKNKKLFKSFLINTKKLKNKNLLKNKLINILNKITKLGVDKISTKIEEGKKPQNPIKEKKKKSKIDNFSWRLDTSG